MHPPTSHFKNVFDVYKFSTISNLFYSNMPYAFSAYIENVRTKCIIFGEALKIRVKKFKQNFRENYLKSTEVTIAACKFSKNFRGSMPPDPPRAFASISFKLVLSKKIRLKKVWKLLPPPSAFKISRFTTA